MKNTFFIIIITALLFSCKDSSEEIKITDISETSWISYQNTEKFEYFQELTFTKDSVTVRNMSMTENAFSEKFKFIFIYPRFFIQNANGSLTIGELIGNRLLFKDQYFELYQK